MLEKLNKMRNEEGFTLIELLIVIIVLGILVAIVLFSLGTFKSDSASAACKADVKQVKTAETAYFAKNNTYTTIGGLVSNSYLQSAPSSSNYTISVDTTSGAVSAGASTSTSPTGCP